MTQNQQQRSIYVQGHAALVSTPLEAEALALSMAAKVTRCLNLQDPTFLTDCLTLAKVAADRDIRSSNSLWKISPMLASYISDTLNSQAPIDHIKREINGVAHNLAHQSLSPQYVCYASSHRHDSCPLVSVLESLTSPTFVISAVHCFKIQ